MIIDSRISYTEVDRCGLCIYKLGRRLFDFFFIFNGSELIAGNLKSVLEVFLLKLGKSEGDKLRVHFHVKSSQRVRIMLPNYFQIVLDYHPPIGIDFWIAVWVQDIYLGATPIVYSKQQHGNHEEDRATIFHLNLN